MNKKESKVEIKVRKKVMRNTERDEGPNIGKCLGMLWISLDPLSHV